MAKKDLVSAKKGNNNEFYTLLPDIENELKHYKEHFKNKVVYCNCDDPFESNFFKFFALNFKALGLKKLICTSYAGSPIVCKQLRLFGPDEVYEIRPRKAWKIEITDTPTASDGSFDLNNKTFLNIILQNAKKMKNDGDFRSDESIKLLKQADIVVTNPPFALFREYIDQLIKYDKKFIILGNMNAIGYQEVFPLIKENKLWCGYGFNMSLVYKTPYENKLEANRKFVIQKGYDPKNHIKVPAVCWFTNLNIPKRNETIELFKQYKGHEDLYPKYDNYEAIECEIVKNIPFDYKGIIGVPITFLGSYNPEQFEIIGMAKTPIGNNLRTKVYGKQIQYKVGFPDETKVVSKLNDGPAIKVKKPPNKFKDVYYTINNDIYVSKYARILIKRK